MILLLGASGYIGQAFFRRLKELDADFACLYRSTCDYTRFTELYDTLKHGFSLVINCAAFVAKPSVDLCEDHKSETLLANTVFPQTLLNACEITGVPLIHVSTGCLYNGANRCKGYSEEDSPHLTFDTGAGVYVGSKALAERIVSQYDKAYICRIRLPFDQYDNERNYLSKIQRYPKVYSNVNSLAHRGDFVNACLDLWEKRAKPGIYNCTNRGAISAFEIVGMIRDILKPNRPFFFWDEEEFMQRHARVPKSNCVLSVDKLASVGINMRHVTEAVEDALRKWVPEMESVGQ